MLGALCPLLYLRKRPKPEPPAPKPRRIAILGGGMAGLSAAYQLTKTPELRRLHHVTVYQLGWRLGGKAASGRDAEGRNIEHGLHVWFGCYENVFRMVQELYAARTPKAGERLRTWQDAVKPQNYTPVGVQEADGTWRFWPITWPRNNGTPGDGTLLPSVGQMLGTVLGWVAEFLEGHEQPSPLKAVDAAGPPPAVLATPQPSEALREASDHIGRHFSRLSFQNEHQLDHLVALMRWARDAQTNTMSERAVDDGAPYNLIEEVLAILHAAVHGIVYDLVLKNRPFESLDDEDFRDWLVRNGAERALVDRSTVIRVVYDTLYQYVDGDVARPSYAAGTALGVIARLIGTYKGAMMWDIQAGMGEVMVAPLYEHLVKAGVAFKFFRKVTRLEPAPGTNVIEAIHLDRQAELKGADYQPTIQSAGMTCWPDQPLWDQLADGAGLKERGANFESYWCPEPPTGPDVLRRGQDFDDVVLAISLGAYKQLNETDRSMVAELTPRSGRFADFVANVGIVPTQSVQLWCDPTTAAMGWTTGKAATVSGPEYLNIWADMTQVIAFESWANPPGSLHYLTGTYKTTLFRSPAIASGVPKQAREEIRQQAIQWLDSSAHAQWPLANSGNAFRWEVLRAPEGTEGPARFDAQYWRANIDPTECCTLSCAGTTKYRLHPHESGFDNLWLAGEGTRHGFNTTAIEGAVMSGMAASRAICGQPEHVVGYDFLQRRPSEGPGR